MLPDQLGIDDFLFALIDFNIQFFDLSLNFDLLLIEVDKLLIQVVGKLVIVLDEVDNAVNTALYSAKLGKADVFLIFQVLDELLQINVRLFYTGFEYGRILSHFR